MFTQMVQYFYPDLRKEEIKKFGLLALAFFLTIGAYWALRLLKDVIFMKLAFPADLGWCDNQGILFQPTAKKWSVVVVIALVFIYSKLVDLFQKQTLFYIIGTFYSLIFGGITIGLIVQSLYGNAFLGKALLANLGWIAYFAIESFGSICVALFWSFTASVVTSDEAKRGYPLIATLAQIGAILGSVANLVFKHAAWQVALVSTICVTGVMLIIKHFMAVIPEEQRMGNKKAHSTEEVHTQAAPKTKQNIFVAIIFGIWGLIKPFLTGLYLIATRGYLFGILIVSTFYEVINTIVDYQMKSQAGQHPYYSQSANFQEFLAYYGIATNTLAFVMALLGTSYLIKRYGLVLCILIFPVCLSLALAFLYGFFTFNPTAGQLLWATFGVMMIAKGLSYAVSNPTKEMMYIPTSKDAKYKAKSWIDMFGGRLSKAAGASITDIFKSSLPELMVYGTMISFGLIGFWFAAALYVGLKNAQLTRDGKIVE